MHCYSLINVQVCCCKKDLYVIHFCTGNSTRGTGSDGSSNTVVDIKTDVCAAYEVVGLRQQKVVLKENPAYEEIGRYAITK